MFKSERSKQRRAFCFQASLWGAKGRERNGYIGCIIRGRWNHPPPLLKWWLDTSQRQDKFNTSRISKLSLKVQKKYKVHLKKPRLKRKSPCRPLVILV